MLAESRVVLKQVALPQARKHVWKVAVDTVTHKLGSSVQTSCRLGPSLPARCLVWQRQAAVTRTRPNMFHISLGHVTEMEEEGWPRGLVLGAQDHHRVLTESSQNHHRVITGLSQEIPSTLDAMPQSQREGERCNSVNITSHFSPVFLCISRNNVMPRRIMSCHAGKAGQRLKIWKKKLRGAGDRASYHDLVYKNNNHEKTSGWQERWPVSTNTAPGNGPRRRVSSTP